MTDYEFKQWVKMAKERSQKLEGAPFVIRPEKMLKIIEHIEKLQRWSATSILRP